MTTLRRVLSALIAIIALCSMISPALAVTPADYDEALEVFVRRQRRFGGR